MKLQVKFKTPGFADCDIEVQAKGFLAASVYWADKNGPLPEWSSLAVFPINPSGTGSYSFDGHRAIPIAATACPLFPITILIESPVISRTIKTTAIIGLII